MIGPPDGLAFTGQHRWNFVKGPSCPRETRCLAS
jgi:hypothetical protein